MALLRTLCRHLGYLQVFRPKGCRAVPSCILNSKHSEIHACQIAEIHSCSSANQPISVNFFERKRFGPVLWSFHIRYYAKKSKDSGGKKEQASKKGRAPDKPNVQLTAEELNEVISFDKMKQQMDAAIDHLRKDYAEQLALRTSASVFDNLNVETSDGNFSLIQIAQVIQKNPQLMLINLAATPQYIPQVKTAIANSGMNVNVQQDGTSLFVPTPRVTREHRELLAKNAKSLCEKTKERLRNTQNSFARELKKSKDTVSADLIFNLHETIMSTAKEYIEKAEALMEAKQHELLNN